MYVIYSDQVRGNQMARFNPRIITIIAIFMILTGCSSESPVQPELTQNLSASGSVSHSNRHLWGLWEISIDALGETEIIPVRLTSMHLNIASLLENFGSTSCLAISNVQVIPGNGQYDIFADVTLTHPLPGLPEYTGFDVRGIVITNSNIYFQIYGRSVAWGEDALVLSNADGYTSLFNPTEFPESSQLLPFFKYYKGQYANITGSTANLNPFRAFCTDKPRCMFESGTSDTETYHFILPALPFKFGYAVDSSWVQVMGEVTDPVNDFPISANCPEPWKLEVTGNDAGSQYLVYIKVYDHQGKDSYYPPVVVFNDWDSDELIAAWISDSTDYTLWQVSLNTMPCGNNVILVRVSDKTDDSTPDLWDLTAFTIKTFCDFSVISNVNTGGTAYSVAVSDGYAYVADYTEGFHIVDVDPPETASIVASVDIPIWAYDVDYCDGYVYLANDIFGLQIIDVDPPGAASIVVTVDTPGHARGVAYSNGYAYVADFQSGLQIIDVEPLGSASIVNTINTPGYARGLAFDDGYVYVADYDQDLQIIEVDTPDSASIVGSIEFSGQAIAVKYYHGCAYVMSSYGLKIINVVNPASPSIVKSISAGKTDVAISDGYAYVTGGTTQGPDLASIYIIDVNPTSSAAVVDSIKCVGGYGYGVDYSDGYAYMAAGALGLCILRIW